MARPKNQAERRIQLIDAATRAVLESGPSGPRLADIAQRAGLTSAAVLYYYPDVRELLSAVLERGREQYCTRREEHVASAATVTGKLRACIRSGVPRPGPTEEASRLLYELAPVVLRNAAAAQSWTAFIDRQSALYLQVLDEGARSGDFHLAAPAPVLARGFVALEDGYGMDVLTGAATTEQVEQRLLEYARIVTGMAGGT